MYRYLCGLGSDLMPIQEALLDMHFLKAGIDLTAFELGKSPAHRRLAFEELFLLQVALAARQRSVQVEKKGLHFNPRTPLLEKLGRLLPFQLTTAQDQVIREIFRDMISPRPMNRLVQGDVGAGKTVVALHADCDGLRIRLPGSAHGTDRNSRRTALS